MFTTYILYSLVRDRYYIGFTSGDLSERLRKHNTAHGGFTGKVLDWEVVYHEIFPEKSLALQREREIKKWKSRKMIEALIKK